MVKINIIFVTCLPVMYFIEKGNGGCAMPGFTVPLVVADPGAPSQYPPSTNWVSWLQIKPF